jgi:hypothetical protein
MSRSSYTRLISILLVLTCLQLKFGLNCLIN